MDPKSSLDIHVEGTSVDGRTSEDESSIASPASQIPDYVRIVDDDQDEIESIEYIYDYVPGGHHPVHLGDLLDGRFEVVHKLGCGGFAIVWLCYDIETEQWRAVKILKAEDSTPDSPKLKVISELRKQDGFDVDEWHKSHLILPLEYFWLDGPNGRHLCEVMPVLGPKINHDPMSMLIAHNDPGKPWRICRQIAEAVKFLHEQGICHGDLTDSNVLQQLEDISVYGKTEMLEILGEPKLKYMSRRSGADLGPSAPEYIVLPTDLKGLELTDNVGIVDFGESFKDGQTPESLGIPGTWAAPEAMYMCRPGRSIDVWSLACIILNTRFGITLFGDDMDSYTRCIEALLGPLPLEYREAGVRMLEKTDGVVDIQRKLKNADPKSYVIPPEKSTILRERIDELKQETGQQDWIHAELAREHSLMFWDLDKEDNDNDYEEEGREEEEEEDNDDDNPGPEPDCTKVICKIPDKEVRVLGDLLTSILQYDPSERPDIDAVLEHEWFKVGPLGLGATLHDSPQEELREQRAKAELNATQTSTPEVREQDASTARDDDEQTATSTEGDERATSERAPRIKDDVPDTNGSTTQPSQARIQSFRDKISRILQGIKNWGSRDFDKLDLVILSAFIAAIALAYALWSQNRPQKLCHNPACGNTVLVVTSAVKSSTSTYLQGLAEWVDHWTGATDGLTQCECQAMV